MDFIQIIRLLARYFHYIALTAILLAGLVFFSTKGDKQQYASHTLLNTGLISGYNIESNKTSSVDYAFTNNELENLINLATSYETNKELSASILTRLLYENHRQTLSVRPENLGDLQEIIQPLKFEISDKDDLEGIYKQVVSIRDRDQTNLIYELTNSNNPFFGIEQLETINVSREGKSDMIRMEYVAIDPFISQYTLELLTSIFIEKHRTIKNGQSESVIGFFEEATAKTSAKLKAAEDELLRFRVRNKIINYYEQTRFISGNKEELDKQYQEELKVLAGARSSLAKIELEIADKGILPRLQAQIANNRYQLSNYTTRITELDLLKDTLPQTPAQIMDKARLNVQIDSLKTAMTSVAQKIIAVNKTPSGIETKEFLSQWLNSTITREESAAKLDVMTARKKEYEVIYARFAPLGSTLKRLEREIDVAEREYLENLHSYNQARLHKYNMLMSSNLKVIDAPYYPLKPEKSKRAMLIILAFMVGLVLPAATLIGFELLDTSLKNPKNAAAVTKLKIAGTLPKVQNKKNSQNIDFKKLNKSALNLFMQELRSATKGIKSPATIVLFSISQGEGKSFIQNQIEAFEADSRLNAFLGHGGPADPNDEFDFRELPALIQNPYSESDVKKGDVHILVCKADRKWTDADKHALKVYKKMCGQKPLLFLNGVSTHVMEDMIGEIPRKRTWLRKLIKRLLTQGLKSTPGF
ncbi:MAG: hypothetical protein HEP71_26670 [Roseivirga sp.]|nr:hypothetical protein [Roseivirga sp.]